MFSINEGIGCHWVGGTGKVLLKWFVNPFLGSLWMMVPLINLPARMLVVIERGGGGVTKCNCILCLCCTLYVILSAFVRVWTSFNLLCMFYVLFWTSLKDMARDKAKGNTNSLSQILSKKEKKRTIKKRKTRRRKKKKGTSGWDSFVVAYFQPTTSIDHLQVNHCFDLIKVILCWSVLFNVIFCLTDFTFSVYLFILCQN